MSILPIDNVKHFLYQVAPGRSHSLYRAEIHKKFDHQTTQRNRL